MTNVSFVCILLCQLCILEQAWATPLTHRGDIDETANETEAGDAEQQQPLSYIRQMITEDVNYRAEQRNSASNAKNEQHDEEQDGEQLWYESEARQCVRIGDEG